MIKRETGNPSKHLYDEQWNVNRKSNLEIGHGIGTLK